MQRIDSDAKRPNLVGYPANFIVAGRRCLVVGAGRIAQRKLEALLKAGADVVVVAPGDLIERMMDSLSMCFAMLGKISETWTPVAFVAIGLKPLLPFTSQLSRWLIPPSSQTKMTDWPLPCGAATVDELNANACASRKDKKSLRLIPIKLNAPTRRKSRRV
jgi:hypothetical protein